jgi:serine/threonine protein kinase
MVTQQGASQEEETLERGTLLAVYYRVREHIGPCSFGTLYEGEHIQMSSRVAIRVLASQWRTFVRSEDDVERFRRSVRDASMTCHGNIAQVFDAGRLPDGRLFMVTEFLVGTTCTRRSSRTSTCRSRGPAGSCGTSGGPCVRPTMQGWCIAI